LEVDSRGFRKGWIVVVQKEGALERGEAVF